MTECSRCGDEMANTLPSPYMHVSYSHPESAGGYVFCVAQCAPVIMSYLDTKINEPVEPEEVIEPGDGHAG